MSDSPLQILLVDDAANVEEEVREGLRRIGVQTEINYQCPTKRNQPFGGCKLPVGTEFNKLDLALIDLELFPPRSPIDYEPDDLRGGSEILPYLREHAPWLPAIAYSHLFRGDAEHFLAIATGFGFDGHTTRGMLDSKALTQSLWETLLQRARLLRLQSVLGPALRLPCEVEVQAASTLDNELTGTIPSWRELVQLTFHFAKKVVLQPMRGGFSGARVCKAFSRLAEENGAREGQWVVKLSSSPWLLHREARAHLRMVQAGVEFGRAVTLLWPDVVASHRAGAIAYQVAMGSREAAEAIEAGAELAPTIEQVATLLRGFYSDRSTDRSMVGDLLRRWMPREDRLRAAATQLGDTAACSLLSGLANRAEVGLLGESILNQRTLIHGDLHLGNIMLGPSSALVDFARSDVGPIAYDAARLSADFLIRAPSIRATYVPHWDDDLPALPAELRSLERVFNLGEGDWKLFNTFLRLILAVSVTYPDLPESVRSWILAAVR